MEEELVKEFKQIQIIYETILNFVLTYSFQLVGATIILIVGLLVAGKISRVVAGVCERKGLDVTLTRFLAKTTRIILVVMVGIICLNKIGISITPLVAAIGALSLGAGLAVQGLLSNYGAGLNIIFTRMFLVGDTITVKGVHGQVSEVLLGHTVLKTEDDDVITIPNKHIVGEIICNTKHVSLLSLAIGVAYSSDLDSVQSILLSAVTANNYTYSEKPPMVGIAGFGESSVDFEARVWVESDKLNQAKFSLNKALWDAVKQNNIDIPFPQREVKLLNEQV